jgi:hypothetical protein
MARLFGRDYTKQQLMERVGSIDQIAGARPVKLADGNEADALAVAFKTGSGLSFLVDANRGLDIVAADWQGASLCWRSMTGDMNSAFFESPGMGWLRGFFGGLLATCGSTYMGFACNDAGTIEGAPVYRHVCAEGECDEVFSPTGSLGLHGRHSYTPAKNVYVDGRWEGDDYIFWAQGKVRDSMVFGPNMVVDRRVSARLGENKLLVQDIVTNEGWEPQEHMYLYHCNLGFPVVDGGAEYMFPCRKVTPRTDIAAANLDTWSQFPAPTPHQQELVYYHECGAAPDGTVYAGFANRGFNSGQGLGVYLRWNLNQLPWLIQWKMPGQGHYVTGLEPATALVDGRVSERQAGRVLVLEPQESREYELEIGVLTSVAEIDEMAARISALK